MAGLEEPQLEATDQEKPANLGFLEILETFVDLQVMGGFVVFDDHEALGDLESFGDLRVTEVFGAFGDYEALAGLEAFGDLETMKV